MLSVDACSKMVQGRHAINVALKIDISVKLMSDFPISSKISSPPDARAHMCMTLLPPWSRINAGCFMDKIVNHLCGSYFEDSMVWQNGFLLNAVVENFAGRA